MILSDAKSVLAKYAGDSGICEGDERLTDAINEARRILYQLGEWDAVMEPICVCPINCKYVLPAKYEYAKSAYVCNRSLPVLNSWYVGLSQWNCYCGNKFGLVVDPGHHATYREWGTEPNAKDCGTCNPEGFLIRLKFGSDTDVGATIRFKGIGIRGEEVWITRILTGDPFIWDEAGGNDRRMVKLTHVIKPKTTSWIRLEGYDGENFIDMAHYEGEDINPSYMIYNGYHTKQAVMKVKRRYRLLRDDNFDEVEFNPDVMIHALQAIAFRESKNFTNYTASITSAVALLNKEKGGKDASSMKPLKTSRMKIVTGLVN